MSRLRKAQFDDETHSPLRVAQLMRFICSRILCFEASFPNIGNIPQAKRRLFW